MGFHRLSLGRSGSGRCRQSDINFDLNEIAPTVIRGGKLGNKGKYKDHTPEFLDILDIMRNRLHGECSRILFGAHYPISPMETFKGWKDLFKNLPTVTTRHGYDSARKKPT